MSVAALVCPHCEKPVEIQVAGVTRSRPCPSCGEMLMLQVTQKGNKSRRRALLMGGTVPEVSADRVISLPTARAEAPAPEVTSARIDTDAPPPPPALKARARAFDSDKILPADAHERAGDVHAPTHGNARPPTTDSMPRPMILEPSHEPRALAGDAFDRMRLDPEVREFRRRLILGSCIVAFLIGLVMLINWLSGGSKPAAAAKTETVAASTGIMEEPEPPPVAPGSLVFKPLGKDEFQRTEAVAPPPSGVQSGLDAALSVEVLRKFLAAPDWRARMAWCRTQPELEQKMADYYKSHADGPLVFDNIVESRDEKDGFLQHTVIFEGGGRRQAHVEKTLKGPRVDWESFIGLGAMNWSDFMSQRTLKDTQMRVMVKEGFYYANQFGSPRLLLCVEMKNVAEPGAPTIHGYLERDSQISAKIESWLRQAGGAEKPMILRLRYPADSRSETQVWVTDAVCPGWLLE